MIYKPLTYYTNSPVSRGGSKGGSEIFAPPLLCPLKKKFKIRPSLGIRTESLLYVSCHFNAFMFCDILMIYIT